MTFKRKHSWSLSMNRPRPCIFLNLLSEYQTHSWYFPRHCHLRLNINNKVSKLEKIPLIPQDSNMFFQLFTCNLVTEPGL
jgi:hypothetical protein